MNSKLLGYPLRLLGCHCRACSQWTPVVRFPLPDEPDSGTRSTKPTRFLKFAILLLALCVGCEEHVNTRYGKRGMGGGNSVNGTSVLADMFESAGHRVKSWRVPEPDAQRRQGDCVGAR